TVTSLSNLFSFSQSFIFPISTVDVATPVPHIINNFFIPFSPFSSTCSKVISLPTFPLLSLALFYSRIPNRIRSIDQKALYRTNLSLLAAIQKIGRASCRERRYNNDVLVSE